MKRSGRGGRGANITTIRHQEEQQKARLEAQEQEIRKELNEMRLRIDKAPTQEARLALIDEANDLTN